MDLPTRKSEPRVRGNSPMVCIMYHHPGSLIASRHVLTVD